MSRSRPILLAPVVWALAVALSAGCDSGDDDQPAEKTGARAADRAAEQELEERERKEDERFDMAFRGTPFDRLVGELPIREPPLYVEQQLTFDGSHRVHTRVDRERFLCGMSVSERKAAVEAYYREADRVFRRHGVRDFVQVVSPLTQTATTRPALAVARDGSVTLTRPGRARGPC